MKKIDLKLLVQYLQHSLRFYDPNIQEYSTLFSIDFNSKYFSCLADDNFEIYNSDEYDYFPILRPLSDLPKEIEVNGEKLVTLDYFACFLEFEYGINSIDYKYAQKLFEWHFDVFGLIDKGLAIDINTLPQS